MKKPLIFITNDDGIFSKGIRTLIETVSPYGQLVIVAPDKPQSGMGHAITINNILRMSKSDIFEDAESYTCTGTPVDCVKLAIYELMKRKPDIILSGINHGANTCTSVLYSGTMSAAVEGSMEGIPSIGFSLTDYHSDADFTVAKQVVKETMEKILKNPMPRGISLNINIPKIKMSEYKGLKVCRAAHAYWEDRFDKRQDQYGTPYYWLTGEFSNEDKGEDTDLFALGKGFASVVPVQFDLTAYHAMAELNGWGF